MDAMDSTDFDAAEWLDDVEARGTLSKAKADAHCRAARAHGVKLFEVKAARPLLLALTATRRELLEIAEAEMEAVGSRIELALGLAERMESIDAVLAADLHAAAAEWARALCCAEAALEARAQLQRFMRAADRS